MVLKSLTTSRYPSPTLPQSPITPENPQLSPHLSPSLLSSLSPSSAQSMSSSRYRSSPPPCRHLCSGEPVTGFAFSCTTTTSKLYCPLAPACRALAMRRCVLCPHRHWSTVDLSRPTWFTRRGPSLQHFPLENKFRKLIFHIILYLRPCVIINQPAAPQVPRNLQLDPSFSKINYS
jgi:hypothetical protein